MKSRRSKSAAAAPAGPSQRQLRAGELIRHALAQVLREVDIQDPAVHGVIVTVTEVRVSPDLRNATVFVEPLGAGMTDPELKPKHGGESTDAIVAGLNRVARFLRSELARRVDLKTTPDLNFVRDRSFETAAAMDALFLKAGVGRAPSPLDGGRAGDGGETATAASRREAPRASQTAATPARDGAPVPDPASIEGEGR